MAPMAQKRLQPIGERLWLVEGPLVSFYGFPYNTAHGAWQSEHGTAYLRRALAWLGG